MEFEMEAYWIRTGRVLLDLTHCQCAVFSWELEAGPLLQKISV
jgi:hypothetical protein